MRTLHEAISPDRSPQSRRFVGTIRFVGFVSAKFLTQTMKPITRRRGIEKIRLCLRVDAANLFEPSE